MLGLSLNLFKTYIEKQLILTPLKDDFINSWVPDATYNYQNIQIYNGGEVDSLYGLIKFNLNSIVNKTIKNATLKLYADSLDAASVLGIKRIITNWQEGVVTYNTKPTIAETVYFEDNLVIGSAEWKTIDITSLIKDIANGAINEGFWLYCGNEITDYRFFQFSSKEGLNAPQLLISYY